MFYLCLIEKMRSYIMQQQDEAEYIDVYGARVHNLKNIDAHIPRGSLTVMRKRKIVLGFRHAFCRRPAALH